MSEWIEVTERLPEETEDVLLAGHNHVLDDFFYIYDGVWFNARREEPAKDNEIEGVIYWHYVPPLPTKGGENW